MGKEKNSGTAWNRLTCACCRALQEVLSTDLGAKTFKVLDRNQAAVVHFSRQKEIDSQVSSTANFKSEVLDNQMEAPELSADMGRNY